MNELKFSNVVRDKRGGKTGVVLGGGIEEYLVALKGQSETEYSVFSVPVNELHYLGVSDLVEAIKQLTTRLLNEAYNNDECAIDNIKYNLQNALNTLNTKKQIKEK